MKTMKSKIDEALRNERLALENLCRALREAEDTLELEGAICRTDAYNDLYQRLCATMSVAASFNERWAGMVSIREKLQEIQSHSNKE